MSSFAEQIAGMSWDRLALFARRLHERLEAESATHREPIAILGMGCRLPGGADPEAYWRLLDTGGDAITEVPAERWEKALYYHPDPDHPGTTYCWQGGFLDGIERFDPGFFGISPRESQRMDPQQKLLLEVIWETLEHAGLAPSSLAETPTGVFIGISTNDFLQIGCRNAPIGTIDAYFGTGSAASIAAGRISYLLGFQGPNYPIDTACSSSLVAVHAACQSLQNRECHAAVVAGVNLMLAPETTIYFSKVRALSLDGRCKTFDAAANGYVRSEGCAAVILKRLADAIRDGDRVLALIRGSAVNHDGTTSGLTVPNGGSQEKVLRAALASAALPPDAMDYIEAHGTGTALGDPIEMQALGAVYGDRPAAHPLWVGSVKTNIGHTEAAAGLASLLKVVLALQHNKIPPHLHFHNPNPYIPWERYSIRIPTSSTAWPNTRERPRIAGISAFGFSGTNAHIVLEETPPTDPKSRIPIPDRPIHLVCLSGKTNAALQAATGRLLGHLQQMDSDPLADIAYSTNKGRNHFAYRSCIRARSQQGLISALEELVSNPPEPAATSKAPKIAFLYSGQGSQYYGMGRTLYQSQPIFRAALDECDALLRDTLRPGLLEALYYLDSEVSPLSQTGWTQPALFALQYALTRLWKSWGIEPAVVLGHSIGEFAAAWAAGLFSWQDGLRLAAARGSLFQSIEIPGTMIATMLEPDQIEPVLEGCADSVSLAAINGPRNVVFSGTLEGIDTFTQRLDARGVRWQRLDVSHAFHSPLTEPILAPFTEEAKRVVYNPLGVGLISNVTGRLATFEQVGCASYWRDHIRLPVRFADGIRTLFDRGYHHFVEIGPQGTLCGLGQALDIFASGGPSKRHWLPSLRRTNTPKDPSKNVPARDDRNRPDHTDGDWNQLTQTLRQLYLAGSAIHWQAFDAPYHRQLITLPTYPFQRRRDVPKIDPQLLNKGPSARTQPSDPRFPNGSIDLSEPNGRTAPVADAPVADAPVADAPDADVSNADVSNADVSNADVSETSAQNRLYEIGWVESPRPPWMGPGSESGHWLIIADTNELAETLVARLEVMNRSCHRVRFGTSMAQTGRNEWSVRIDSNEDWHTLLRHVLDTSESAGGLEGVLFLPGMAPALWPGDLHDLGAAHDSSVSSDLGHPLRSAADGSPALGPQHALPGIHDSATFSNTIQDAQCQVLQAALHLTQGLITLGEPAPRLIFVTRGAQRVIDTDRCEGLAHAPLWGFARTVAIERPQFQCTRIDLPWSDQPDRILEAEHILEASFGDDREDQIAIRGSVRYVARLTVWESPSPAEHNDCGAVANASLAIPLQFRGDATYWITGGAGGIGILLARWLVDRGARHIILSGRRTGNSELETTLERLRTDGSQVDYLPCDVGDAASVRALLESIDTENRRLAGIFHLAGVLDDGFLAELSWPQFETALRPKLAGAWHLHEQTLDRPIDFLCFFSSIAAQLGSPKQANYAAANAFLDGLAEHRRAAGLPATSIGWGPWAEAGMAARIGLDQPQSWRTFGIQPLETAAGVALLEQALAGNRPAYGAMRMDWNRFFQWFPPGLEPPLVRDLVSGGRRLPPPSHRWCRLVREVQQAPEGERPGRVRTYVHAHLAAVLGIDPAEPIDPDAGFFDLGMDSLMAVELHAALQADLGDSKVLPITFVFSRPTLDAVTDYLLQHIAAAGDEAALVAETVEAIPTTSQKTTASRIVASRAGEATGLPTDSSWAHHGTETDRSEPIAVIGFACRFPGHANDPDTFWQNLVDGVDAIIEIPPERWDIDTVYDPNPEASGKMNTRWGGFIDHVDRFDAAFFGISPREAVSMDPQHRILLETCYEALENSQLDIRRLAGSRTGIYIGISGNDYLPVMRRSNNPNLVDGYLATGNSLSIAAGRIAHVLGFQGPCLALDTACSSSLVSVHLACESLRVGESTCALAGGVNLILNPDVNIALSKVRAISPDGRCKTFDALANGYVRSEGCGIVVLKRFSQAQEDGDPILGIIRSSAINHDGRSGGLTVPNGASQQALLREALQRAGLVPDAIDYIEAHGTGTALGDPIELTALGQVYRGRPAAGDPQGQGAAGCVASSRPHPLQIGSVKTNLGHLEAAAGIAGLIKTLLALQHERIPPHLHLRIPTPNVDWESLPVEIPTECRPWPRSQRPRIAGVSSFGFSGTNAHVLIEEAPALAVPARDSADRAGSIPNARSEQWLSLSAKSEPALHDLAARYRDTLHSVADADWPAFCHTANAGRAHYEYRLTLCTSSTSQAAAELAAYCNEGKTSGQLRTAYTPAGHSPQIAMLFTGQGGDLTNLGQDLYRTEPLFRAVLDECDALFHARRGKSLLDTMHGEPSAVLHGAEYAQPALYALQMGLARLWGHWGVLPSAVFGHSTGQFAAACVAGVFSLQEGMHLITERGRIMQQVSGTGAMMTANLEPDQAAEYLAGTGVAIAAINGPRLVTLSGPREEIEQLANRLDDAGISVQQLNVTCGFHSSALDPILEELRIAAGEVVYREPRIGLLCNLTGDLVTPADITDPDYWVRIAREPVQFLAAMRTFERRGYDTFLEVGPQPTLLALGRQMIGLGNPSTRWLPSLRPNRESWRTLLDSAAALYRAGHVFHFQNMGSGIIRGASRRNWTLPNYPFQRQRYWIDGNGTDPSEPGARPEAKAGNSPPDDRHAVAYEHPLLGNPLQSPALAGHVFEREFASNSPAYLQDHAIYSFVIAPGASHLAMALCAAEHLAWEPPILLEKISFPEALILPEDESRTVQLIISPQENGSRTFRVMSCERAKKTDWAIHAIGQVRHAMQRNAETDILGTVFSKEAIEPGTMADELRAEMTVPDIEAVQARCTQTIEDARIFYIYMARGGVELGPSFQWLSQIWRRDGEALARLVAPLEEQQLAPYLLHPGLIDSCIQLVAAGIAHEGHDYYAYIPVSAERFRFHRSPRGPLWAHALHRDADGFLEGAYLSDLCLFDPEGIVAEIRCIRLQRAPRAALKAFAQRKVRQWSYRLHWSPAAERALQPAIAAGSWLLFADPEGLGERLAAELENQDRHAVLVTYGESYQVIDRTHYQINPQIPEHFKQVLRESLPSTQTSWAGVIHLASAAAGPIPVMDATDPAALFQQRQDGGCRAVLALIQALSATPGTPPPRLWLVTRGALAVDTDQDPNPIDLAQAPLWGMGRVVAIELPQFRCVRIDLDPVGDLADEVALFIDALRAEDREDQVAYRHQVRYLPRLIRGSKAGSSAMGNLGPEDGQAYQLVRPASRVIDQLDWRPVARTQAGPGELEMAVRATGLNFRDVLNALDLYPGDAGPLGFECAGTVTDVGPGVTEYRPGDRVVAIAPGCFARYAVADCRLVAPIPDPLSLTGAATIPIVFLTAEIGIEEMAQLQPGESILIHSAAGGVGLAALQIAHKIGATVLATAGSEEKRTYIRSLGVEHVFDSRSLDFADQVLEVTGGRGVDAVISALPGDYVKKNIEALAEGGRFIEIGKSDLWNARRVAEVRVDIRYHTLALDQLALGQLDRIGQKLRAVMDRFQQGLYQPLPETVFPHEQVKDAFRYMAQAKHIGKVVVSQPEPSETSDIDAGKIVQSDATYLITGGLGGLGLLVSQWLINQGAAALVLVGRRPPNDSAAAQIESMREQGATIRVLQADVSKYPEIERVFQTIDSELPPLRGILHAAGTLDDGVLARQDWSRFESVMAPKAWGALHLDRLCRGRPLDWFVMFSSAASLLGGPGQGNYAAANAVLDALAHERCRRGEPAMSINWGPWSGAGMAMRTESVSERQWAAKGVGMIAPSQGLATLASLMAEPVAQVGVLDIDWSVLIQNLPPGTEPPLIVHLAAARRQSLEPNKEWLQFVDTLKEAPPAERQDMLVRHMQIEAARVMGQPSPDAIDPTAPLTELGFDSLMAVEMVNQLSAAAGISLPTTLLFDYPNLEAIAGYIVRHVLNLDTGDRAQIPEIESASSPAAPATAESLLASIEELSDDEVAAELERTRKP